MARSMWLSVIVLAAAASGSRAIITLMLDDPVDDRILVDAVLGQKPVKEFAAEIEALERTVTAHDVEKIEKLFGKPARKAARDYAMPVAQPRTVTISGIRYADEKLNKDHTEFYPTGDFAGIEVWYGIDGKSP